VFGELERDEAWPDWLESWHSRSSSTHRYKWQSVTARPANGTVDLELQDVSAKTVESLAEVLLTLRPLDRRGPLFGGTLVSSADAATGRFHGPYAARQSYPPQRHLTTLRLEAGERRTIKLELLSLRWSLAPNWAEQPREFWELAGRGTYLLHALLLPDEYPKTRVATKAHRLRIEKR